MTEIRRVLEKFPSKKELTSSSNENLSSDLSNECTFIDIPEVFFTDVIERIALNRNELRVILYLYRQIYCYPNLYEKYGISQLNDLLELSKYFKLSYNELHKVLKSLESYELIQTIRSGQYFIRRYFLAEYDEFFGQVYDDID